ncbi:hypothetical protein VTI28DRAFT_4774 [Corynascus sepedonium]
MIGQRSPVSCAQLPCCWSTWAWPRLVPATAPVPQISILPVLLLKEVVSRYAFTFVLHQRKHGVQSFFSNLLHRY